LDRWVEQGFTHIWLMGVWTTGPRSRAQALNDPAQQRAFAAILPDWRDEDVAGSPFAVADYKVPRHFGGEAGLAVFREALHRRGSKLVLDFVPNHLGLDHAWVRRRPELFVQCRDTPRTDGRTTPLERAASMAHGRDPNFPAWMDTVQLDYRRQETHRAGTDLLLQVAARCDGVRCDMAMLTLSDVFARTWGEFPCPDPPCLTEFWAAAIAEVRQRFPGFLFLAEVYWNLEARLQALGFDYTYDKVVYDFLTQRRAAEVQSHLLSLSPSFLAASAHFLENHDEPRIAGILTPAEHRAAALLILGLPGLRLLHDGQLTGARVHTPVHLARRPAEEADAAVAGVYQQLLRVLPGTAVGAGEAHVLPPRQAWNDNRTHHDFVVVQWQSAAPAWDLVVVNLASHRSQCYVPLAVAGLGDYNWRLRDLLGNEVHERRGDDLHAQGLYLDVAAHGAQLFHAAPIP
jgi:hypothetical protein